MRSKAVLQIAFVSIVIMAAGCDSNNKGKIEGTKWVSEATKIRDKELDKGLISLEFTADGKLVYDVSTKKITGNYTLGMGDRVTLNFDQEVGHSKKHTEKIVINGNKLTMMDSDGTSLTFSKVTDNQPQEGPPTGPENGPKKGGPKGDTANK